LGAALIICIIYFSLNPKTNEAMNMVNIMGSASTLILGIVAISLSVYYYHAGVELNKTTYNYLSRIESQTTSSADILKGMLQRFVDIIENIINEKTQSNVRDQALKDDVKTKILSAGEQLIESAGEKLDDILKATNPDDKEEAKKSFFEEIDKALKSLRNEVGEAMVLQKLPTQEIAYKGETELLRYLPSFVRRIRDLETEHTFLGVNWLRNTKFKDKPLLQELLQLGIDNYWLLTERVPNPNNPNRPVLACKLNRERPKIKEILKVIESEADI
jgi:hypothetical protein